MQDAERRAAEAEWREIVKRVREAGDRRFREETERLKRLGILDRDGKPTTNEWPPDMKPGSKADLDT